MLKTFASARSRRVWFCLLLLGLLALLAACGDYGSNGYGSTTTSSSTTNNSTNSTPASSNAGTAGTAATGNGQTKQVEIVTDSSGNFAFSPATLTIPVGTTVTWKNTTDVGHTVSSDDGKTFNSGDSTPLSSGGGTFSFTFTAPGTFAYHCDFHPSMKATIIVQGS